MTGNKRIKEKTPGNEDLCMCPADSLSTCWEGENLPPFSLPVPQGNLQEEGDALAWLCSVPWLFRPMQLKLLEAFGSAGAVLEALRHPSAVRIDSPPGGFCGTGSERDAMPERGTVPDLNEGSGIEMNSDELLEKMLGTDQAERLRQYLRRNPSERQQEFLASRSIRFLPYFHPDFPEKLKHIPDPPLGLFVKGRLPQAQAPSVGIVGARLCTKYGKELAESIARTVVRAGGQVISGGAYGIDGAAQKEAAERGESFAVLGCGVEVVYPADHRSLFESLAQSGGLISEYGPLTQARPFLFPFRNRIISGLSDVVVVVEAKKKSGSLITATYAAEQGREVYAVPGRPCDQMHEGCNELISQGAGIFLSEERFLEDVLVPLGGRKREQSALQLSHEEQRVYAMLGTTSTNIAELSQKTGLSLAQLGMVLLDLEEKGLIRESVRDGYIRL